MKNFIKSVIISLLVTLFLGNLFSQTNILVNTTSVKVNISVAYIKDSPNSFGKTISQVNKGATFKVIEIKDPWVKVKFNETTEGWINKTAFADRKNFVSYKGEIKSDISTTTAAARSINVSMVSGFNSRVFVSYKENKKDLKFSMLDEIESSQVNIDPLQKYSDFRKTGKLGEYK